MPNFEEKEELDNSGFSPEEKEEEIKCDICGEEFKNKAGLGSHKRFKHNEEVELNEEILELIKAAREDNEEILSRANKIYDLETENNFKLNEASDSLDNLDSGVVYLKKTSYLEIGLLAILTLLSLGILYLIYRGIFLF